ncbi:urease accessory protein UreD [Pararhodonellum marinum]|uniref:urease accessory protein UreD n=1 Tax=Pararhodonellum marinum TaxID=2755358 RepID=UPI00188E1A50|nr:urease accessory protein UreD [Pararhodonellum marinum]
MIKEIGKLHITVGFNAFGSYLKDKYFTPPFKIANVGENRNDPACYLMTMSSSPGILDDDDLDIQINLEAGSRMMLLNQGYQRLFTMKKGAKQQMTINLQKNSELSYIQHPIVPQSQSIFHSKSTIHLEENCIFTYGEIITCGRKLCGEIFHFKRFQNLTEVFLNQKLILKDNILLQPDKIDINALGQVEGYTHQATLMYVNSRNLEANAEVELMHEAMSKEEDLAFGVSQPLPQLVVLRVLGNGGEQLLDAFKKIEKSLWELNKHINKVSPEKVQVKKMERETLLLK